MFNNDINIHGDFVTLGDVEAILFEPNPYGFFQQTFSGNDIHITADDSFYANNIFNIAGDLSPFFANTPFINNDVSIVAGTHGYDSLTIHSLNIKGSSHILLSGYDVVVGDHASAGTSAVGGLNSNGSGQSLTVDGHIIDLTTYNYGNIGSPNLAVSEISLNGGDHAQLDFYANNVNASMIHVLGNADIFALHATTGGVNINAQLDMRSVTPTETFTLNMADLNLTASNQLSTITYHNNGDGTENIHISNALGQGGDLHWGQSHLISIDLLNVQSTHTDALTFSSGMLILHV
jgi:hypothetical protein